MANCLIIGGQFMLVGDGSAYWGLGPILEAKGHSYKLRECIQSGKTAICTLADILWADHVIAYSYGGATTWRLWNEPPLIAKTIQSLTLLAAVPDETWGQIKIGLWHKPAFVARARCFDVKDIPISCTFKDGVDVNFGDALPDVPCLNIHCDNLFPGIHFPAAKHIGIKEMPDVLQAITDGIPPA